MSAPHRSASLHALAAAVLALSGAHADAASFTYHGELLDGDVPANGSYDLRVRSFTGADTRKALGEATELLAVRAIDGRFSVELDVPEDADGVTWVDVAVRAAGSGDYVALGAAQAVSKGSATCPGAWALDGNVSPPAGSFLGIADAGSEAPLELRARDAAVARFTPAGTPTNYGNAPIVLLGSTANEASGAGATVSGGGSVLTPSGSPCADCGNRAIERFATVSGGWMNSAETTFATIGGGIANTAQGFYSVIPGGNSNLTQGQSSVVSGGTLNVARSNESSVVGGYQNVASGEASTVAGGENNCAGGDHSFAAGYRAKVRHGNEALDLACAGVFAALDPAGDKGSFVWADTQAADFVSTGANQFLLRAGGGVMINTNTAVASGLDDLVIGARSAPADADADLVLKTRSGKNARMYLQDGNGMLVFSNVGSAVTAYGLGDATPVAGRYLATGANGAHLTTGGTWTNGSSRAFKHAFEAIDAGDMLARVLALPLSRWQYRDSKEGVHLGPMAEDFAAAFGLGSGTQHISTVDADGVALAAIQGLNEKLVRENDALQAQLSAQAAALDAALERLARIETQLER